MIYANKRMRYELHSNGSFPNNKLRAKKIRCVETQEIFNSASEASLKLNISISRISQNALHGDGKKVKGFSFQYLQD